MTTKVKTLLVASYVLLSAYTLFAVKSNTLADPNRNSCPPKFVSSLYGWNSGCHYSAFFENSPSLEKIMFEHSKLNQFSNKNGLVGHVLWYQFVFHQRFQEQLGVTLDDLEKMLFDLLKSNPRMISIVTSQIHFLDNKKEKDRAQQLLTRFCNVINLKEHPHLVTELDQILVNLKLEYSTLACR